MAYRPELTSESLYDDKNSDHFVWYMDDAGMLHAVAGGRYQRAPDSVMIQVDAASGEIVSATKYDGAFTDIENGPGGQAVRRLPLQPAGALHAVSNTRRGATAATGHRQRARMGSLVANSRWLMLFDIGRNDGEHRALSRDGGQTWQAMDTIRVRDRDVFDPTGAGLLRFGYTDRSEYYPYYWIRP